MEALVWSKEIMKRFLLAMVCLAVCFGTVLSAAPDFQRYSIILDRKPFGEAPPPEEDIREIPLSESFARHLRLCALLEDEELGIRVGLVNSQTKKDFFLAVGDIEDGIELVSASYEEEEAVVKKGSEMAVINLKSSDIKPLNARQQKERMAKRAKRPSYAERRKAREERRRQKPPPPDPKYVGEELEKHLQDYQMEVIRQGLPPLPIPLTDEMDNQLVDEGVLPPIE